jgi:hypothetical protein
MKFPVDQPRHPTCCIECGDMIYYLPVDRRPNRRYYCTAQCRGRARTRRWRMWKRWGGRPCSS